MKSETSSASTQATSPYPAPDPSETQDDFDLPRESDQAAETDAAPESERKGGATWTNDQLAASAANIAAGLKGFEPGSAEGERWARSFYGWVNTAFEALDVAECISIDISALPPIVRLGLGAAAVGLCYAWIDQEGKLKPKLPKLGRRPNVQGTQNGSDVRGHDRVDDMGVDQDDQGAGREVDGF